MLYVVWGKVLVFVQLLSFLDIDECKQKNNCHANATCFDTEGSYYCTCNSGYVGTGDSCRGKYSAMSAWSGCEVNIASNSSGELGRSHTLIFLQCDYSVENGSQLRLGETQYHELHTGII